MLIYGYQLFLPPYNERGRITTPSIGIMPGLAELDTDKRNTPEKGGSARLWSYVVLDLCKDDFENRVIKKMHGIGESIGYMESELGELKARASAEDMEEEITNLNEFGRSKTMVEIIGSAALPLIKNAPNIDYDLEFEFTMDSSKGHDIAWSLEGDHDGFPAYEVFIGKSNVYFHTPKEEEGQSPINPFNSGQTLASLLPPMEFDVEKSGIIPVNEAYDKDFVPPQSTEEGYSWGMPWGSPY